jgi:hypothetical protein
LPGLTDTTQAERSPRPARSATPAARQPSVRRSNRFFSGIRAAADLWDPACEDPIDSPGGYQILGKTLSPFRRWAETYEDHFLLRSFDTVRWVAVDEAAFRQLEADFLQGGYKPKVEHIDISFREIQALEDAQAVEVAELRRRGRAKLSEYGAMCVNPSCL